MTAFSRLVTAVFPVLSSKPAASAGISVGTDIAYLFRRGLFCGVTAVSFHDRAASVRLLRTHRLRGASACRHGGASGLRASRTRRCTGRRAGCAPLCAVISSVIAAGAAAVGISVHILIIAHKQSVLSQTDASRADGAARDRLLFTKIRTLPPQKTECRAGMSARKTLLCSFWYGLR